MTSIATAQHARPLDAMQAEPSVLAVSNSEGASIVAIVEPSRDAEFDAEDHERGMLLRRSVAVTMSVAVFVVGKIIAEAADKFEREGKATKGRNSILWRFLDRYLPAFDRKLLQRYRQSYMAFAPHFAEMTTACPDLLERFDATAIYLLSQTTVSREDREVALEWASKGKRVDAKLARSIIGQVGAGRRESLNRMTIDLPAGKVTLAINHGDYRQALTEAIWRLEDDRAV